MGDKRFARIYTDRIVSIIVMETKNIETQKKKSAWKWQAGELDTWSQGVQQIIPGYSFNFVRRTDQILLRAQD